MVSEVKFKETELGRIPEDWTTDKLGNNIKVLTDYHANGSYKTLKKNVTLLDEPNYAIMIRTTNFEKNCFNSDFKYISKEAYEFLKKSSVFPNDILMNKIANAGSVYLMPDLKKPVSLAMNLFLIRIEENLNQEFVYWFLKHNERYVKSRAQGSVTKTITKENVRNLLIAYPKKDEQDAIVDVLKSYREKIELNQQMNTTLEQIAQALFKRWFIDFEFPDENGNPYKSSGGRMVDSELGEIPEGWRVGKLGNISGEKRKNIKVEDINPETPYFGLEHIPRKSISLSDWGNASEVSSNKLIFEKNDVLFGKIRPYFHKVGVAPIDGVCSTDIIVISPEEEYYSFILSIVSSEKFVEYATQTSEGTKMPRANWKTLVKYPVVTPDKLTSKRYDEIVLAFVEIIQKNIFECKNLSQIRDSLLPKLMSGKIRAQN